MASIGEIHVDLSANTATFTQEMGRARGALRDVRTESSAGERALASFAAKGIGEVIPAAQGAEFAIHKLIDRSLHAAGALRVLGQAGAIIGGSLLVAVGVQRLQEEIKNWLALGETISQTTERLKQEAEEQDKFAQRRKAAVSLLINLEGQLARARAQASEAALKAQGDEPGALGANLEAQLAAINTEKQLRDRNITEVARNAEERRRLEVNSTLIANAQRLAATENYFTALKKLQEDATQKQIQQFQTETEAMVASLQRRIALRKQLEDEAKTAATRQGLGDVFQPFEQGDQIQRDAESIAKGFALLLDKGKAFRDVFPEIIRVDQEFEARGFSGFRAAVENFRGQIQSLGIGTEAIGQSFDAVKAKLADLPAGLAATAPAIDGFNQRLFAMEAQALRAANAVQALANSIATTQGPPVSAAGPTE